MSASVTAEASIQLGPLKGLSCDSKRSLLVTASGSRYSDDEWDYLAEIPQKNIKPSQAKIVWGVQFEDGSRLTDDQHAALLEATKDFIGLLRLPSAEGRTSMLGATTIIAVFKKIKPLLHWMAERKLNDFTQLTPDLIERYVAHVRSIDKKNGEPLSQGERFKRCEVLEKLWRVSGVMDGGLPSAPFKGKSAFDVSGFRHSVQRDRKFQAIPDNVAVGLANVALSYVESESERILSANEEMAKARQQVAKEGKSKAVRDRRSRDAVNKHGYDKVAELTKAKGYLRTACYIVIAMLSGIRDSEMASLLRNCAALGTDLDPSRIKGRIYKTAASWVDAEWMVPPVVCQAVRVAERLSEPLRARLLIQIRETEQALQTEVIGKKKQGALAASIASMKGNVDSIWLREGIQGLSIGVNKGIHQQLHDFIAAHAVPLYEGVVWSLHPHQFRRTFVKFMVKNAMNLKYLQKHFRHLTMDMTAWYDIEDTELTKDITEFYKEMTKEKLREFVTDGELAGKGGDSINELRNDFFRGHVGESVDTILDSMCDTVTLRSTGVSWCMGDVENGECSGLHGCLIDPANASTCNQAVISQEFRPAWEQLKAQNEALLTRDDLGKHQKAAIKSFLDRVVTPTLTKLN